MASLLYWIIFALIIALISGHEFLIRFVKLSDRDGLYEIFGCKGVSIGL